MTDLTDSNHQKTESFERFVALSPGQFWMAKTDNNKRKVTKGQLLMIASIDDIDNAAHTIHVRLHPSVVTHFKETTKYLVDDFLTSFDFVEKEAADKIRENEILAIQNKVKEEQSEMEAAFTNPALLAQLVDKEMPVTSSDQDAKLPVLIETMGADIVGAVKTQNLTILMAKGLTSQGIEQIKSGLNEQKSLAERHASWIKMRTERLSKISAEIIPYYHEKSAIALAYMSDMKGHVDNLMKGIGNLDLYILKDVEIITIREGKDAPIDEKLTMTQRVLYMDEELAVYEDVKDNFDHADTDTFLSVLAENDALIEQIFPTNRCVISVATTRKHHDYSRQGYDGRTAQIKEMQNKLQYLLVRNGDNIYVVFTPNLFNQYSHTLFPTTTETEDAFRGMDGSNIKYDDLDYTSAVSKHDRISLGYKRLLILLCGLDHNKALFGRFYPDEPSLEFVSIAFQEKYMHFIHDVDGEGLLTTHRPKSMTEWVAQMNNEIGAGSRVLIQGYNLFSEESIPSAFYKTSWRDSHDKVPSLQYRPTEDDRSRTQLGVLTQRGNDLFMEIEVSGKTIKYVERTFNAKFNLTKSEPSMTNMDVLCIDRLNVDDALWYLHDRPSRVLNTSGIRMLKRAIRLASDMRAEETPLREKINKDLVDAGIFDAIESTTLERHVDHAISKWRCANPKLDFTELLKSNKLYNQLLDLIYTLTGKGYDASADIIANEKAKSRELIFITIDAQGRYVAYSSLASSEEDNRLINENRVSRSVYKITKQGAKPSTCTFVYLSRKNPLGETIVNAYVDDDTLKSMMQKSPAFPQPHYKTKALEWLGENKSKLTDIVSMKGNKERTLTFIDDYIKTRYNESHNSKNARVVEPITIIPLGLSIHKTPSIIGFMEETKNIICWLVAGDTELSNIFAKRYSELFIGKIQANRQICNTIRRLVDEGQPFEKVFDLCKLQTENGNIHNLTSSYFCFSEKIIAYRLDVKPGYNFSLQSRVDTLVELGSSVYMAKEFSNVDDFFNIIKPLDWKPIGVIQEGFIDKSLYIYDLSDTSSLSIHFLNRLNFYDTWEEMLVENEYSIYKTTIAGVDYTVTNKLDVNKAHTDHDKTVSHHQNPEFISAHPYIEIKRETDNR